MSERKDLQNDIKKLRKQWKKLFEGDITEGIGEKLMNYQYGLQKVASESDTTNVKKLRKSVVSLKTQMSELIQAKSKDFKHPVSVSSPRMVLKMRYIPVALFGFLLAAGVFVNPLCFLFALALVGGVWTDSYFKFANRPTTLVQMLSSTYFLTYEGLSLATGETILAIETIATQNIAVLGLQMFGGVWSLLTTFGIGFPIVILLGVMYLTTNKCKGQESCSKEYGFDEEEGAIGEARTRSTLITFIISFLVMSFLSSFIASYELMGDLLGATIGSVILWAFYLPAYIIPLGLAWVVAELWWSRSPSVLFATPISELEEK